MKSKLYYEKMRLIAMVIVLLVVLTGCGKQVASTESAAAVLPSDQEQGAVNSDVQINQVMSQKELELRMLFRGLLQMDNKGELIITKEQAQSMLPIVSKSTEDGEITADNQQKLMGILTPEQKTFMDELTARIKQFSGNRNNPNGAGGGTRPVLTDEQRAEFQKNQSNLTDEERKKLQENRNNRGNGQAPASDGQGGQGNGGFGGFGQNVEQQLLDLLDSKINN
jgi:hypothetical protein